VLDESGYVKAGICLLCFTSLGGYALIVGIGAFIASFTTIIG
jgi:hypothetical protein